MIRILLFILTIGIAYGELRLWPTNEETYATFIAEMVSTKYKEITAAADALDPVAEACYTQLNASSDDCQACISAVDCAASSSSGSSGVLDAIDFLNLLKNVDILGTGINIDLVTLAEKFAEGAELLFTKYGPTAFEAWHDGLEEINAGLWSMRLATKAALESAFAEVGNAIAYVIDKFKDLLGKRRRRATMVAGAIAVREKRAEVSAEAQECMAKCPDCTAFVSGDQDTAMRAICGDALVDEKNALEAQLAQLKAFYTDWEGATKDLLQSVYIDTTTSKVATVSALKGGVYVTFDCASAGIAFDAWNQDPTYKAIAEFIYNQY